MTNLTCRPIWGSFSIILQPTPPNLVGT